MISSIFFLFFVFSCVSSIVVVSLAAVITLGTVCLVKYSGAPCMALSAASMCSSVVRSLWYSVQYMNLAHKMMISFWHLKVTV